MIYHQDGTGNKSATKNKSVGYNWKRMRKDKNDVLFDGR